MQNCGAARYWVRLLTQGAVLAVMLASSSCEPEPLAYRGPNTGNGHRGASGVFDPSIFGTIKPRDAWSGDHFYLCGLRYPDGYDWHKDPQKGSVECTLFLLRDGESVLELPVGVAHNLSSDSDMHRIVGGKLYTEYSTDTESIVACNGEEVYRVQGRERLRGLVLKKNDLYTLCEARDARRWVLRRDGAACLEGDGSILHDLAVNDGTMEGKSTSGGIAVPKLFFVTLNGTTLTFWEDAKIHTSMDVTTFLDLHASALASVYAAGMMGVTLWCVFYDGARTVYRDLVHKRSLSYSGTDMSDYVGNETCVYVLHHTPGSALNVYGLGKQDGATHFYSGPEDGIYALCVDQQQSSLRDAWTYLVRKKGKEGYALYTDVRHIDLPEGLVPYSRHHFGYLDGHLFVSLQDGGCPVLYHDGQINRYTFNGYIDGWGYGK